MDTVQIREPSTENGRPSPALVLVWSGGRARSTLLPLGSRPIVLGRSGAEAIRGFEDDCVSRAHVEISMEGSALRVRDLGSRNGTFVDGERVTDKRYAAFPRALLIGQSLFVFEREVVAGNDALVTVSHGEVIGPSLARMRSEIDAARGAGEALLLVGPTGAGKELAARYYHASLGRSGPFVAINCSTLPVGLAERLLFGARRGSYSGADADSTGYVQEAHGGTLFLDEVAELDPQVQPKLLRLLEAREYVEIGGTRPRRVDLRVCAATHKDLVAEAALGRFREDLYYRLGKPEVRVPGLRDRAMDIAHLVEVELARASPGLLAETGFVYACLRSRWPGNVRQMLSAVRQAAQRALTTGRSRVTASDLARPHPRSHAAHDFTAAQVQGAKSLGTTDEDVRNALRCSGGNVSGAARALGWHRTQLRRWLKKNSLSSSADVERTAEAARCG